MTKIKHVETCKQRKYGAIDCIYFHIKSISIKIKKSDVNKISFNSFSKY